jgi:hypothetical protein
MCLRRAPEKYIAGAALDRAGLKAFFLIRMSVFTLRLVAALQAPCLYLAHPVSAGSNGTV